MRVWVFWLVVGGGAATVAGLILTAVSVRGIRAAAARRPVRLYGDAALLITAALTGGGVVTASDLPPLFPARVAEIERRLDALDSRVAGLPAEVARDAETRIGQLRDAVVSRIEAQVSDAQADLRQLVSPLVDEWRSAGWSVALLIVGVAAQTVGGVLALYAG